MGRSLKWLAVLSTVILGATAYVGNIQATPSSGFAASTISVGRLQEFDVTHHLVSGKTDDDNSKPGVWLSLQKTKGYDLQLDYSWDMGGGQFALRHLASYQPVNSTLTTKLSTFYT